MTDLLDSPAIPGPSTDISPPHRPSGAVRERGSEGFWWAMATAIALIALIFAVIGLWLPSRNAAGPANLATEFDVELTDLSVAPNHIEVPAGETITLHVKNAGAIGHDLKLDGQTGTELLGPGKSETIQIGPFTADAEAWCTVPGHKQAGMLMHIAVVGGSTPAGASASAVGAAASGETSAKLDPNAEPSAGWVPFDPALKPAPGGKEHVLEMHASEKLIEVAPGVTPDDVDLRRSGARPDPAGQGRRPVHRDAGQRRQAVDHSIDFHASKVAWNDEMRSIAPGESLVYQFEAQFAGIFMYHCGTAPALHHIGNGMYGALIIDPPELGPVDHEYILVQSELYLGPQDGTAT